MVDASVNSTKLNEQIAAKALPDLAPVVDETSPKWNILRESLPPTAKVE